MCRSRLTPELRRLLHRVMGISKPKLNDSTLRAELVNQHSPEMFSGSLEFHFFLVARQYLKEITFA